MTDQPLITLLTALDIAPFERTVEGEFRPLAPPPAWFTRLGRDGTFPFLGHILAEALSFWSSGRDGVRVWGPCVDAADDGKEFHYMVKALTVQSQQFLVFQVDDSAERIREVLQKVRSDALADAESTRLRRSDPPH